MTVQKPTHPEAFTAMIDGLTQGIFTILFSDEMTDEEAQTLHEDIFDACVLTLEVFDATFTSADEWSDETKAFTMKLTIPNRPVLELFEELQAEMFDSDE